MSGQGRELAEVADSDLIRHYASLGEYERAQLLEELSDEDCTQIIHDWRIWARPEQLIPGNQSNPRTPDGSWVQWLVKAGRGWGKALALDTPIPTASGWTTMGALREGDMILGADGQPCRVTYVTPVQLHRQCYRITFSDGMTIIADAEHQWAARSRADRRAGRGFRTVTTAHMLDALLVSGESNWEMPAAKALRLPAIDAPVDPWVLGLWLGDGTSVAAEITIGDQDASELLQLLKEAGFPVTGKPRRHPDARCATYPIGGAPKLRDAATGRMLANDSLTSCLRGLGVLGNKRIPRTYLRASIEQRQALLAGLIDSDGYVEHVTGKIEITLTKPDLAADVVELARTLGHRARMHCCRATIDGRDCGPKYRIQWVARSGGGRISRKQLADRSGLGQPNRLTSRYVHSIEPVQSVPVRCITVDSTDSLYLAGEGFLVTHNTRVGAETVREWVKSFPLVNLIGATADDARDIMIEGESGILAICPRDERPQYKKSQRKLIWPNGAKSLIFTADEPERLRGKQHMKVWADELAAWRYKESWDQVKLGLRLGASPQAIITTTPRPTEQVKELIADPYTVVTNGHTYENQANLSPAFINVITKRYEGTRLGRQELGGEVLDDNPNALWKRTQIEKNRITKDQLPDLIRIVVGVDPSVTSKEDSDLCGIVVVGIGPPPKNWPQDGREHGYVLADASLIATPHGWGKVAVKQYYEFKCDRLVAEVNNGGELVEFLIKTIDDNVSYKSVSATRGKIIRAEPISALDEQGRMHHVGSLSKLEDELCDYDPLLSTKSPDRMDAFVWAATELFGEGEPGALAYMREQAKLAKQGKS